MKKLLFLLLTISLFAACKDKAAEKVETKVESQVEKAAEKVVAPIPKGTPFNIDLAKSVVTWEGQKPTGKHVGTINVQSGTIYSDDSGFTGGSFVLDMNSISCTDLEGDKKASLESHLKGLAEDEKNDFFNVLDFPTASFDIKKVIELKNSIATHMAMGNLTIKGVSVLVGIKCNITSDENSIHIVSKDFKIDRTKWGINFMSKSKFPDLKDKFLFDNISLGLDIVANK